MTHALTVLQHHRGELPGGKLGFTELTPQEHSLIGFTATRQGKTEFTESKQEFLKKNYYPRSHWGKLRRVNPQ